MEFHWAHDLKWVRLPCIKQSLWGQRWFQTPNHTLALKCSSLRSRRLTDVPVLSGLVTSILCVCRLVGTNWRCLSDLLVLDLKQDEAADISGYISSVYFQIVSVEKAKIRMKITWPHLRLFRAQRAVPDSSRSRGYSGWGHHGEGHPSGVKGHRVPSLPEF